MALNIFKNKETAAKKQAKEDYIKAAELKSDLREVRAFKMRIALRCRAHVDSAFIEGAKKTAKFQESAMLLASQGKEKPEPPKPSIFHSAKTINGKVITYLPPEFTEEIFNIGAMYQTTKVDAFEAIKLTQDVADKISFDLGLEEPFSALQFLRDEVMGDEVKIEEEADPCEAEDSPSSEP